MIARILNRAPELELSDEALDQPVAYAASTKEYATLRDYIAVYAPDLATEHPHAFGETERPVRRVTELTQEELQELTCARLAQADQQEQLLIIGAGNYTIAALAEHVRKDTPLGRRLVNAAQRSIYLLESLVDAGKVRPAGDLNLPTKSRVPKQKY